MGFLSLVLSISALVLYLGTLFFSIWIKKEVFDTEKYHVIVKQLRKLDKGVDFPFYGQLDNLVRINHRTFMVGMCSAVLILLLSFFLTEYKLFQNLCSVLFVCVFLYVLKGFTNLTKSFQSYLRSDERELEEKYQSR